MAAPQIDVAGYRTARTPSSLRTCDAKCVPFGARGAATYDDDAARMPERYKIAHAIQNDLVVELVRRDSSCGRAIVVDLGTGTANDGVDILDRSERALYMGIDISLPMVSRAKHKMLQKGHSRRSAFLVRDFRTTTFNDVERFLRRKKMDGSIAVVISALALHHYNMEDKRPVYELAHALLQGHGCFVLTDLFINGIPECARSAVAREVNDIEAIVTHMLSKSRRAPGSTTLSVAHYLQSNKPQPLAIEVATLHDVGFGRVDIVYRHGQLASIVAERVK